MMDPSGGFDDTEEQWKSAWSRHYQVNVQAPARLMRAAVRHFRTRAGGVNHTDVELGRTARCHKPEDDRLCSVKKCDKGCGSVGLREAMPGTVFTPT